MGGSSPDSSASLLAAPGYDARADRPADGRAICPGGWSTWKPQGTAAQVCGGPQQPAGAVPAQSLVSQSRPGLRCLGHFGRVLIQPWASSVTLSSLEGNAGPAVCTDGGAA